MIWTLFFNGFSDFTINDKKLDSLLHSLDNGYGKSNLIFKDSALKDKFKGMDYQIFTDSVTKDGKTTITQKIIINSKDKDVINDSIFIMKQGKGGINEAIASFGDGEDRMGNSGYNKKEIEHSDDLNNIKHIDKITLSDADLLVRAGIPAKLITAPELHPAKVEVKVNVEEKFGKSSKKIGLSIGFKDISNTKIVVLDKDGRKIFEDVKKKFSGTYHHDVEIEDSMSPYYFLIIRNNQMFGRIIK